MPNWVHNNLEIIAQNGERLEEIIEEITEKENGKRVIDFNKIVQTPIYAFQGSSDEDIIQALNAYVNTNSIQSDEELDKVLNDPLWFKPILDPFDESKKLKFVDMTKGEFIEKYKDMDYESKITIIDSYDWNTENWGTKWNAETISFQKGENYISIEFETPWSPPIPIFRKLEEKYPDVAIHFNYCDPLMGFAGNDEICWC